MSSERGFFDAVVKKIPGPSQIFGAQSNLSNGSGGESKVDASNPKGKSRDADSVPASPTEANGSVGLPRPEPPIKLVETRGYTEPPPFRTLEKSLEKEEAFGTQVFPSAPGLLEDGSRRPSSSRNVAFADIVKLASPGLASRPSNTATPRRRQRQVYATDSEDDNYSPATPRRSSTLDRVEDEDYEDSSVDDMEDFDTPTSEHKKHSFFSLSRLKRKRLGGHRRNISGFTQDGSSESDDGEAVGVAATPRSGAESGVIDEELDRSQLADESETGASRSSSPVGRSKGKRARPLRRATMGDVSDSPGMGGAYRHSRAPSFRRLATFDPRKRSIDGGVEGVHSPSRFGMHAAAAKLVQARKGIPLAKEAIQKMKKKRKKHQIDTQKSAELVAEMASGGPAVLLVARMFQRDEHGHHVIPVLLEQLKVNITASNKSKGVRGHTTFRIELEYGSGLTKMEWTVSRDFRDFFNLHSKYKLSDVANTTFSSREPKQLPKFPRGTFPYLSRVGLGNEGSDGEGDMSGAETARYRRKKRPLFRRARMSSTYSMSGATTPTRAPPSEGAAGALVAAGGLAGVVGGAPVITGGNKKANFAKRQIDALQKYLQELIQIMKFRPDSNRLCKFLEMSALGIRLAGEAGYHGKEGFLVIRSDKGSAQQRTYNIVQNSKKHLPKWFMVRQSYIVAVESPEEMNVYDVILVDSTWNLQVKKAILKAPKELAAAAASGTASKHHTLKINNSERKLKLFAKSERMLTQFQESIEYMMKNTCWAEKNRFESFAPVRKNVFAQWLVDGRDYMWNVSRAIEMAKDVIYIHDWWLSPELYLRRPASMTGKYRLDRMLKAKAMEGVKIYIILYRNINSAIPIDSTYTKYALLDLHPNIYVQRSPNHVRQNTFFWAHHEKILVVDHMIGFLGGIDLCFGRWDTPQHSVADDKLIGFEQNLDSNLDPSQIQLWPGKDYSNPRVQDFYELTKPFEEMYDRTKTPRMPWHDISMQVVGQPARDATRHFIQRWNYLLRQRKPSRPTPSLLPPPDLSDAEVASLGFHGTCDVQLLRSATWWSIGTPNMTEQSIQNAYLKMIEKSEHFVYIENQFFITSCEIDGKEIANRIGDALTERIIRAHRNGEEWRAIVIIPLMPGFQNPVDTNEGTSVRLIMHLQYQSICRGETSMHAKLAAEGIHAPDYIEFYGLRSWGKLGKSQFLTTEQLYIHAKCMIVDDRTAIIGSANINERSMRGHRDSEVAAIVRDEDMLDSIMAGKKFKVGRFPHTLRIRLMREHLGLDVDGIMEDEIKRGTLQSLAEKLPVDVDALHEGLPYMQSADQGSQFAATIDAATRLESLRSFNHDVDWEQQNNPNLITGKKRSRDPRVSDSKAHNDDVEGLGWDNMARVRSTSKSTAEKPTSPIPGATFDSSVKDSTNTSRSRRRATSTVSKSDMGNFDLPPAPIMPRRTTEQLGLPALSSLPSLPPPSADEPVNLALHSSHRTMASPAVSSSSRFRDIIESMKFPEVSDSLLLDPLSDEFYYDMWAVVAENNTKLYRHVFRPFPDNEVKTWKEYKEYTQFHERRLQLAGVDKSKEGTKVSSTSGPVGTGINAHEKLGKALNKPKKDTGSDDKTVPGQAEDRKNEGMATAQHEEDAERRASANPIADVASSSSPSVDTGIDGALCSREKKPPRPTSATPSPPTTSDGPSPLASSAAAKKSRRRTATRSRVFSAADEPLPRETQESLLDLVQGSLVIWPHEFLLSEEKGGNWLYSIDQLAPLEIYS